MGRTVRIAAIGCLVLVGLFALYWIGWGLYINHSLKAITCSPGVSRTLKPYHLEQVASKRKIDLGYATFSLPSSITGEPGLVGRDCAVQIGKTIFLNPPEDEQVIRRLESLWPIPVHDRFEFELQVVSAQPFSFWDIFRIGIKEAKNRAAQLMYKSLLLSDASVVGAGRSNQVGFIVITKPQGTSLWIKDYRCGSNQNIYISPLAKNPRSVVSAIVGDYQRHLPESVYVGIKQQLKNAQIQ